MLNVTSHDEHLFHLIYTIIITIIFAYKIVQNQSVSKYLFLFIYLHNNNDNYICI